MRRMGINTHGHGALDGATSLSINDSRETTMPYLTDHKPSQSPWSTGFPVPTPGTPDTRTRPGRPPWLVALRCRLHRNAIDRELAAGGDPDSSECRHLRASQLTAQRSRESLATAYERFLAGAMSVFPLDAVPLNWRGIRAATPSLDRLAQRLRQDRSVTPQGVARARLLLVARDSALNDKEAESRLVDEARSILALL